MGRAMVGASRENKHKTKGNFLSLTKAKLAMSSEYVFWFDTTKHEGN